MKILMLILLCSSLAWAKEEPKKLKSNKKQSLSLDSADAGYREPANLNENLEIKDQQVFIFGGFFQEGGIYVGGRKTPAEFSYGGLAYRKSFKYLDLGAEFSTLQNQSATKVYSLLGYVGGTYSFSEKFKVSGGGLFGVSKLTEVTTLQSINGSGITLGARLDAQYNLNESFFVSGGLYWYHPMFAKSFWGEDIFSEVVIDFIGPTFSIGWSW